MFCRSVFLSDIHLGTRGCSASELLAFLANIEAETIYLVGDIIDVWQMQRRMCWPCAHTDVLNALVDKSQHGTRIVFIPGNHDDVARQYCGLSIGNVELCLDAEHITADGRRLWLTHGDQFDCITMQHRWLSMIGDRLYGASLTVNRWLNGLRRTVGLSHWSLSAYLKKTVKEAVKFISHYETLVQDACRSRGFDGVICGHIHSAELSWHDDILYINTGDFVESCTAVIELHDGTLRLVQVRDGNQTILREIAPCA